METINEFLDTAKVLAFRYVPSAVFAIIILVVGWWIAGRVGDGFRKRMVNMEISLRVFLSKLIEIGLKVLLVITAAGMIGIETTSFIAVLGAAGLAIGLALQGALANFAGGVLILLFRPFKVGDVIETQGKTGAVTAIQIFHTTLLTPSGETVILPNGAVSNNPIVNYSTSDQAMVEIVLQVDGTTDVDYLRNILIPALQKVENVRALPMPSVDVAALSPGAATISVKVFTKPSEVLTLRPRLLELAKMYLSRHGVKAPVPHTYVHSINEKSVAA